MESEGHTPAHEEPSPLDMAETPSMDEFGGRYGMQLPVPHRYAGFRRSGTVPEVVDMR